MDRSTLTFDVDYEEHTQSGSDSTPAPQEMGAFEQRATLVILTGHQAGRTIPLEETISVGRDPECGLRLDSPRVSRVHAKIETSEHGEHYMVDCGSSNGTAINGIPTRRQALKFGDRIAFAGEVLVLFTQHDELQDQLMHQQRMESIGRLAGGIAHDFNNLLGTVMANTSVLADLEPETRLDDPEVNQVIADIAAATRQATDLTQQLLGFARKGKFIEKPFSISELVPEVVRLCKRTFHHSVRLDVRVRPGLSIVGDRGQLHQVLMNLLLNARDAMSEGGQLTVTADLRSGPVPGFPAITAARSVVLSVKDTGMGMSEETRSRVFEPFFTTKGLSRGTGLGLATVYGIIKNHGGEIRVASQQGVGTTFEICVPADEATTQGAPNNSTAVEASKGKILLVDDDELYVRSSSRLLRKCGYEVIVANSGAEAIAAYQAQGQAIHVVLMDLTMPGMGGDETCRHLRNINPTVKVLAMSGYGDDETAKDMIAAGASGFLRKPFDRAHLEAAVSDMMAGRPSQAAA